MKTGASEKSSEPAAICSVATAPRPFPSMRSIFHLLGGLGISHSLNLRKGCVVYLTCVSSERLDSMPSGSSEDVLSDANERVLLYDDGRCVSFNVGVTIVKKLRKFKRRKCKDPREIFCEQN